MGGCEALALVYFLRFILGEIAEAKCCCFFGVFCNQMLHILSGTWSRDKKDCKLFPLRRTDDTVGSKCQGERLVLEGESFWEALKHCDLLGSVLCLCEGRSECYSF